MADASRIAPVADVPRDGSLLFTVRDGFDREEAILLRLTDGVVALRNYCPHWTDVRLDTGGGATVRNGEVVCENHGATFEKATDDCRTASARARGSSDWRSRFATARSTSPTMTGPSMASDPRASRPCPHGIGSGFRATERRRRSR